MTIHTFMFKINTNKWIFLCYDNINPLKESRHPRYTANEEIQSLLNLELNKGVSIDIPFH